MSDTVFDGIRWKALEPLVDRALSLSPEARASWLADLRLSDPDLATELHALLGAQEASGWPEFLAEPLLRGLTGLQLGAYRLERPLGQGGMGTVWLARRTDGRFEGCAAVKLLNLALLSTSGQERFRREGSMLARLTHPGIGRLLDAGVSPAGQPYLVLEYIEGQRIDLYADEHRLTPAARVELVLQVLAAVDHAHANLIVHRDLKPSNILVTTDGRAKLLDFGIAKLLDHEQAAEALTRDARALTPPFAAPEQLRGGTVTTATDVYAVGVLLYRLLTGRHPYELSDCSPGEIERIVCEQTPPRPSSLYQRGAAIHTTTGEAVAARADEAPEADDDLAAHAKARGAATPDRLRRRLRGDLDAIVLKALRKEPERRYPTAAALQEDLRRFLDGHPVQARPDTVVYRFRKFMGRHRAGVAVAALLALVLAGGVIRERTLRARAEAEAHKAKAVEDYLVSVFDVADPFAPPDKRGADVTARALLDRGAARVDASLADQPEVQAELRGALGRVYASLGQFDKAEPLLRRSLEQRRALHGDRHVDVAEAMHRLGYVWLKQSRFTEAEPLLRAAVAQRRALLGNASPETAHSLNTLATLLQERNDYAAAEPLFREAIDVKRRAFGPDHQDVAQSLNNLGVLLYLMGRDEETEPIYREAMAIDVKRLGEDHPYTVQTVHNLAQLLHQGGRFDESEVLYRRSLASKRKTLGNAHPSVTINLNNLGNLLIDKGEVDEAQALITEALALDRQLFGERHAFVAESLRNLATAFRMKGEFDQAERHYQEARAINRALFGDEHVRVAVGLGQIGTVRHLKGDLAGAIALQREALALMTRRLDGAHPSLVTVRGNLAKALRDHGESAEAEGIYRALLGELDPAKLRQRNAFIGAQLGLGRALIDLGRAAEARPLLERAVEMSRERFGAEHWRTGEAQLALGICLAASGRPDRAGRLLREADARLAPQQRAQPRLIEQTRAALASLSGSVRGGAVADSQ